MELKSPSTLEALLLLELLVVETVLLLMDETLIDLLPAAGPASIQRAAQLKIRFQLVQRRGRKTRAKFFQKFAVIYLPILQITFLLYYQYWEYLALQDLPAEFAAGHFLPCGWRRLLSTLIQPPPTQYRWGLILAAR